MPGRIVFLDPPARDLDSLADSFREAGGADALVEHVGRASDLRHRLESDPPVDLVVVDYFLGDGEVPGDEILATIRETDPDLPVVAAAERGDVDSAARAIANGATDFLVRGERLGERVRTLLGKVRRHMRLRAKNRALREQNERLRTAAAARYRMVGRSAAFLDVVEKIRRVAGIPRPVLVTGERGTGKELVARAVHGEAGPADRPMVTVNCAAFPDNLLESELFGHEKGAFTGADQRRPGKFEQALGGTLFLDEIGHMSLSFQQKILRVVEYGVFQRVGGRDEIRTDARIVAATNADLESRMSEGEFLRDLYDRLSFEVIHVPPLRERPEDVVELAAHFLGEFAREIPAFRDKRLSGGALAALRGYSFPGNVRELKNLIERAAYRDTTNEITPEDIGLLPCGNHAPTAGGFRERVEEFERRLIDEALAVANGNQAQAARALGLSYDQFRYHYRKFSQQDPAIDRGCRR